MNLTEIGGRVKAERRRQGISQEKLAEAVSVSPHYIYEIERGIKAMSLETLINITCALGMSADYLIFGSRSDSGEVPLAERLNSLDGEQRRRAESAFCALLPYIK